MSCSLGPSSRRDGLIVTTAEQSSSGSGDDGPEFASNPDGMPFDTFWIYAGVYADPEDALADYDVVKELHTEAGLIDAYDAAVIERRADGKVKIRKKHETPTRAEIEAMLDHDQTMIDIVFEASIAQVLESYVADERIQNALYGQVIIAAFGGPRDPGGGRDRARAHGRVGPGPRARAGVAPRRWPI